MKKSRHLRNSIDNNKEPLITILFLAIMGISCIFSSVANAIPPGISVVPGSVTPVDGNTMVVARTAANNPLAPPTFQLKADVVIANSGSNPQQVASIIVSYPGSAIPPNTYGPLDCTNATCTAYMIGGGTSRTIPVFDGLNRDLPTPLPASVQINILFANDFSQIPLSLPLFNLAFHNNSVPLGAYFFPAKDEDLPAGQFWTWNTRHVVDDGNGGGFINPTAGSQRYAYDLNVSRWTGSVWTQLVPTADPNPTNQVNSDYLIWGTPIYAMADGVIVKCRRGVAENTPPNIGANNGGNMLWIRHGNEEVLYAHFQGPDTGSPQGPNNNDPIGTPKEDLCPNLGFNDYGMVDIPVKAGQFLGLVGNTGLSTGPHLHIHAQNDPPTGTNDTLTGLPLNFLNIRTRGDDNSLNNLGGTPTLQPLQKMTLHRSSILSPNPCGLDDLPPPGLIEFSRHSIDAECYQDVVNQIVSRGYRPVFVDGYDVGGKTFFNTTFRSRGPVWASRHDMTGAEYQTTVDDFKNAGFRLQQVDSYLQNGNIRFAAIFEKRSGPNFAAFHGLPVDEYLVRINELDGAGFVPINVSTVEVGGETFWTGLFEKLSVNSWFLHSVPDEEYQATFDTNKDAGRILIYVHGFTVDGEPHLTGIWIDPIEGDTPAVHGFPSNQYQTAFNTQRAAGRLTRYTTGYDNGFGDELFASLWRARPGTTITSNPALITKQATATFGFKSTVPFSVFQCQLDGAPFSFCSSPKMLNGLTEGNHTFQVRSVDRESVKDLTPESYSWLVDLTPPNVGFVGPAVNTKTVHGYLKDEFVAIRTIIGWGNIVVSASDALTDISSLIIKVDGFPIPGSDVTQNGNTWIFLFEPETKGENTYMIEATATDGVGNSATTSIEVVGVATGKPIN